MSRSNPTDTAPNPATRWFEWQGEQGVVRYYDRDTKKNVDVPLPFTFLLLDELGSVRGWHDASGSGIYSNEVRDTREDVLIVKAFKGGTLAEGLYKDIKDRVHTVGGAFNANCYVAFKNGDGKLSLGSLRFKGAALGAWMEFRKANRGQIYKQAIIIDGFNEGQKGRVKFRVPTMKLKPIAPETDEQAKALDQELQDYLAGYLKRTKRDQVEDVAQHAEPADDDHGPDYEYDDVHSQAPELDDVPF